MSTTEGFEGEEQGSAADKPALDAAPAPCGARDLQGLLNRIADQIADADRRHSEALDVMQERLVDLARGTVAAREQIAPFGSQVGEQGESRMAALAEKLAVPEVARPAPTYQGLDVGLMDAAPAPLRSAIGDSAGGIFTRKDEHGREVDPFDVVGELRDEDPWDQASAEALTRLYESEGFSHPVEEPIAKSVAVEAAPVEPVAVAPIASIAEALVIEEPAKETAVAPLMAPLGGLTLAAAAAAMATAPAVTAREDIERAWLETKFADIATKLEQSLEALRPDGSVMALEERFERLEAKLGDAMSEAVTRSDVAGLKSIEMQVEDLAQQLGVLHAQSARLVDIEAELRALSELVSDERIVKLMASAAPAPAAVPVVPEDLAQKVAAQVVANLPRGNASGTDSKRLDELRSIVNGFITEQRQGDEQTVTMLDTMQQAMIRLLDRMDALENGADQPAYPTYEDDDRGAADPYVSGHAAAYDSATSVHAEPVRAAVHQPEPAAPAAVNIRRKVEAPVEEAAPAPAPEARAEVKRPQAPVVERTANAKEDFIASARRAAKQAAEAKAEEEAVEPKPAGKLAGMASMLGGAKKAEAATAAAKKGPSKLMIAVLAVFALGASFTIVNGVMKMTKPSIERRINVTPPNIIMERDVLGSLVALLDRDGEPASRDQESDDRNELPSNRSQRSGEPAPRMIAPDIDTKNRVAGTTGRIVDDTGSPVGIVLQHSAAITRPEHVMRLEEQQQHAALSARLGASQRPTRAVPAAMVPDNSVLGNTVLPVTRQDATGVSARTVNEMPPAFIGPTSLRQAAAKGDPSAEFEVGARFAEGKGLQQDLKQAIVWYQRSASQGFAQAQYRLATMYERGLGVKADLARAQIWYQRAADQGTAKAMHNLAVLSTGREGASADYAAAAQWFAKAAAYGLVDSQFNLAVLFDGGLGVAKDVKQAYKWYALAARAGDEEAVRRQEALRGKLAAQELAQVAAEIDAWRPLPIDAAANDPRVAGERWKLNVPVSAN